MQLRLPWKRPPSFVPRAERRLRIADEDVTVEVVRHRRARRYVIRVAEDGTVRLTVPRGASIAGGLRFAERQSPWIAKERLRQADRSRPWTSGTTIWLRGERIVLDVHDGVIQAETIVVPLALGTSIRSTLEARLREIASTELADRCTDLAEASSLPVSRVRVRDQRSRWGACSPRAAISLNWRLIQMPPAVADYVIFHELAHLAHPNHSRRFWREVERLCPPWRDAERWLRKHGKEII